MSAHLARDLSLLPRLDLAGGPSRIERWSRFETGLGASDIFISAKRDDATPFGFGGNKIRKLELVAAHAVAVSADTFITCGGVQSNHCRATAATAAKLGVECHLVLSGERPATLVANTRLDELLGATLHFVSSRSDRAPRMEELGTQLRAQGKKPFIVPLGASTPLGAAAFALGFLEMLEQGVTPSAIVVASSSGGTQAGLVAGLALSGLQGHIPIIGISADESAPALRQTVMTLAQGALDLAGSKASLPEFETDDTFVGGGYGAPTEASREAASLLARTEGLFVDHTYTAKALAGLTARVRDGRFRKGSRVLFWHTGGQVGLFA